MNIYPYRGTIDQIRAVITNAIHPWFIITYHGQGDYTLTRDDKIYRLTIKELDGKGGYTD